MKRIQHLLLLFFFLIDQYVFLIFLTLPVKKFSNLSLLAIVILNFSPAVPPGQVLIRFPLAGSAGTERMLVDFGKANWLKRLAFSQTGASSFQ